MDAKQNFLETINGGKPEAFVNQWEALGLVNTPVFEYVFSPERGKTVVDPWGVHIYLGENEPGPMPIITEETKVCPDITQWQKYIKAPDIAAHCTDWSKAKEEADKIHEGGQLTMAWMATGLFEQSHYLMGFEDTLMNLLLEPEAMHELLDYLLEYRMLYAKMVIENLHPDLIMSHDDWGAKHSLFMKPDTWREFFKPRYEKFYRYMRENSVIVLHHADSYLADIVEDMADIGIQIWQGILPENNIPAVQKRLNGRMALMGGINGAVVDRPDCDEATIRLETARVCQDYGTAGSFIPCLTYGDPFGSINPGVSDIIKDEIDKQSVSYFK